MRVTIDCEDIWTKEELYQALARELDFPEYFGYNLDALYDVLSERGIVYEIILFGSEALRERLGDTFFESLCVVLEESGCLYEEA